MRLISTFHEDLVSAQQPFDAAVVIPTVLRPTLKEAVVSVFRQSFPGRLQILMGIDRRNGDDRVLDEILAQRPAWHAVTLLDLGYSVSVRNGGVHLDGLGGTMRTILSYMANSRYIAYLDDDNWYGRGSRRDLAVRNSRPRLGFQPASVCGRDNPTTGGHRYVRIDWPRPGRLHGGPRRLGRSQLPHD
jgi:hypothetical protein